LATGVKYETGKAGEGVELYSLATKEAIFFMVQNKKHPQDLNRIKAV